MKISIFTATHNPHFLLETYRSIKHQPYDEWVIYPNHGIEISDIPTEIRNDSRTKIVANSIMDGLYGNIGAIKQFVCSKCSGDILVELDHDDLLVNNAISRIANAFRNPDVVFVYSNSAEFDHPGYSPRMYDMSYGWEYRDFYWDGKLFKEAISPELTPYHASLILWAPNHVRAFRRTAYEAVGGHNPNLSICDDQDLMCRLYFQGKWKHIDECCYLYRVHGENSWLQRNADIQTEMYKIQKHYVRSMAEDWAVKNALPMIDLGGRFNSPAGYLAVDIKGGDIVTDLNKRWPLEDSSVGIVRAFDIIEHLPDKTHTMSEIHRVLVPGGCAFIEVPSTDGRGAWQDPTHQSFWNENSFLYYTSQDQAQYIDNNSIRFLPIVSETYFPNDWCQQKNIPYVRADLLCLKDGYQPMGLINI